MSKLQSFRNWNEKISLVCYESLFINDQDSINAFKKYPYSWLMLLIPIVGLVGFAGVVSEENIARRWKELEERKQRLKQS